MRTGVVLVSGVDPAPMASALVSLQWDLARAVAVRHHIDPDRSVLERVVSDASGVIEHEEMLLEHACVTCALREDIVPTLERLAADGRWDSIIAHLPIGCEAFHVGHVLALDARLSRRLKVTSIVAALDADTLVEDLLGDDLLSERGWHSSEDDRRGVGEVATAQVEYADLVVLAGTPNDSAHALVRTLARPDAEVIVGTEQLTGVMAADHRHSHTRSHAWTSPTRVMDLPAPASDAVWQLELTSHRAFHPDRLLEDLERLGAGRHRSRGCFWLPTRPEVACVWEGSGGQLSIGTGEPWGRRPARTRLVLTGVGTAPAHLTEVFEGLLLQPTELADLPRWTGVYDDGFEPWLGPIRDIA
ncbi:CobW family GTP-binding protein [Nocardioides limicola]|uniref:CobW family GTP-binding protein n=1 Tax=Nocardioides limicola TaxID=2803368 RepID=UPI00193C192B|nr:GTP-binding protein [Nocardioides sp. DJM-14]